MSKNLERWKLVDNSEGEIQFIGSIFTCVICNKGINTGDIVMPYPTPKESGWMLVEELVHKKCLEELEK